MKKVILTLCTGIIMSGAAYSLCNAANDYGLATVSLPPAIVAQDDDTNGGDNTNLGPCDGLHVYCETRLVFDYVTFTKTSSKTSEITYLGYTIRAKKSETKYTVIAMHKHCIDSQKPNVCVKAEQGLDIIEIYEGDNTNGDSTNGNGSN